MSQYSCQVGEQVMVLCAGPQINEGRLHVASMTFNDGYGYGP